MRKVILCLSVILVMFLTLSSVQASDVNITDSQSQIQVNDKTFEAIQKAVDSSKENDTVILEGTYSGSGSAVNIARSLTIKGTGSGAVLNANKLSQVFKITSDNVVLENIQFINGKDANSGGAVYNVGNNLKISNCIFTSNSVDLYGGAVFTSGNNTSITNSYFSKNFARYTGGACDMEAGNAIVDNCVFKDNHAGHVGGSISWVGNGGYVANSRFTSDSDSSMAPQYGGAIVWIGNNGKIEKSIFSNHIVKISGAAVYWRGTNGSVQYCIFTDNSAANDSAYCGNPDYVKYNYWGFNINSSEEFLENKLIYYNNEYRAAQNWVNLKVDLPYVEFKLNNGETLNGTLPDYQTTVSGKSVVITDNSYVFQKSIIIQASDMIFYNNGEYFKVTLKDEDNTKLADKSLQIKINNKIYKVQTDKNGEGKVKLNTLPAGRYSVQITFNGDKLYKSGSKSSKLTVKKQKTALTVKVKNKKIQVTLKNQFKKALSDKHVKLTVNKKTYTGKTNKKGIVIFKLNLKAKKNYKFSVKYGGDKYTDKVSKIGKIKIR